MMPLLQPDLTTRAPQRSLLCDVVKPFFLAACICVLFLYGNVKSKEANEPEIQSTSAPNGLCLYVTLDGCASRARGLTGRIIGKAREGEEGGAKGEGECNTNHLLLTSRLECWLLIIAEPVIFFAGGGGYHHHTTYSPTRLQEMQRCVCLSR